MSIKGRKEEYEEGKQLSCVAIRPIQEGRVVEKPPNGGGASRVRPT
jgi:hypothetical protein